MIPFNRFKNDMRSLFYYSVNAEEGETFQDWFNILYDALKEDGKVITKNKRIYILI